VGIADQTERTQVVAEMNAARDEEYGKVLERLPEFLAELDKEPRSPRSRRTETSAAASRESRRVTAAALRGRSWQHWHGLRCA
jgi:hypothetical protein